MDDYPGNSDRQIYYRIAFTEEMINVITLAAIDFGWIEGDLFETELTEMPDIDEIFSQPDVHAWLEDMIADVETRYATVVTDLLREDPDRSELLESAAFSFGEHYSAGNVSDARIAFERMSVMVLDGMPEDHAVRILKEEEDMVEWILDKDLHSFYWEEAGGDGEFFYILREKVVEGMLMESSLTLEILDTGHYCLRPRDQED